MIHHDKQLHPDEIVADSTANELSDEPSGEQATSIQTDDLTENVNSIQISQAVQAGKNASIDSPVPAGETLPLPTAEEVGRALRDSDIKPDDTRSFTPGSDSCLTEPINSHDALPPTSDMFGQRGTFNSSQTNNQTETLPIFNQSSAERSKNYFADDNKQNPQYDQTDYQNAGNVFDGPNVSHDNTSGQQDAGSTNTHPQSNAESIRKKPDHSLFLKRFIPIALMVFSAFASVGIIAHAVINQNFGGYDRHQGPQGGMYGGQYDEGYGYGNYGNADTQSALTLAENTTNGSGTDKGSSANNNSSGHNNSSENNNPSGNNGENTPYGGSGGDYSQYGMPGDGSMQGPPDADMGYMETGLTTPHVLGLVFCAIIFACSLVYIIVTRFGARPFALDSNTKLFSALGVAGIALVMAGGLTAGGNTLMALSSGLSGGNRYGDAGGGYDYGYYDDYSDGYDDGYGYYDDYGDYYYYDNGNNGYTDDNNGNSKDRSKDRSNNNQQPNTNSGSDVNAFDTNNIPYTDI